MYNTLVLPDRTQLPTGKIANQPPQKRKTAHGAGFPDTSRPSVRFGNVGGANGSAAADGGGRQPQERPGRPWTLSVAVAASWLEVAKSEVQALSSVGRLARALAVFCVDEVVVFDDFPGRASAAAGDGPLPLVATGDEDASPFSSSSKTSLETDPGLFASHVLSYLECPPFMRKALFPLHPNLRQSGLLPSLDMPHHPNPQDGALPYREGVVVDPSDDAHVPPARKRLVSSGHATTVDVGAGPGQAVTLRSVSIPPRTRVTLHFPRDDDPSHAEAVDPAEPRAQAGLYWGYAVRRAGSLSAAITESPFVDDGGYDVTVGTSERGDSVTGLVRDWRRTEDAEEKQRGRREKDGTDGSGAGSRRFKHLLVVFGGRRGLEYAAENDAELSRMGIRGARTRELFDHWVDVLPNQGSRTIRTDEALFIALTALRPLWDDS